MGLDDEAHLDQQPLQFSLQVCEQGQQAIEAIARRVSDPKSSAYGRYLSHSELAALAAPVPLLVARMALRACDDGL